MPRYEVAIREYDPDHPGYITRRWPETYDATSLDDAYHQAWEQYRDTEFVPSEWSTRQLED